MVFVVQIRGDWFWSRVPSIRIQNGLTSRPGLLLQKRILQVCFKHRISMGTIECSDVPQLHRGAASPSTGFRSKRTRNSNLTLQRTRPWTRIQNSLPNWASVQFENTLNYPV